MKTAPYLCICEQCLDSYGACSLYHSRELESLVRNDICTRSSFAVPGLINDDEEDDGDQDQEPVVNDVDDQEDEDVDAVAMSLLNGAHGTLFPRVVKAIKKKGIKDVLIVGGGVIPDVDHIDLIKAGIDHVFGPGTPLSTIIDHITLGVSKLRKI